MPDREYVLYFAGGTMTGVFGAGIVTALEEANIYPRIEAVYGSSAGVMNAAYFISRQTKLGSSIYWQDLNKDFISLKGFWVGVWQRFQNKFIRAVKEDRLQDAINTNYLMEVVEKKKILDIDAIISSPVPFYVKLLNLETRKVEFVDARRKDILNILKAGVHVFPYVHGVIEIDGKKYVDAGIPDIIGIRNIVNRHPDKKIVVFMNSPQKRALTYRPKNFLEGKFMMWMFNDPELYPLFAYAEDMLQEDFEYIKTNPNIILVCPPDDFKIRSRTTHSKRLLEGWNIGLNKGREFVATILTNSGSNIVHPSTRASQ